MQKLLTSMQLVTSIILVGSHFSVAKIYYESVSVNISEDFKIF